MIKMSVQCLSVPQGSTLQREVHRTSVWCGRQILIQRSKVIKIKKKKFKKVNCFLTFVSKTSLDIDQIQRKTAVEYSTGGLYKTTSFKTNKITNISPAFAVDQGVSRSRPIFVDTYG